jgi:aspartate/methionine/tyrosine aminotransferase
MPDPLSPNVQYLKGSETVAISNEAKRRRAAGEDVLDLSVGEPDFDTPAVAAQAGIQAIQKGMTRYPPNIGLVELRVAIARRLSLLSNGRPVNPDNIVVSSGSKQSIFNACFTLFGPTDQVLIPAPAWVSYPQIVHLCRAEPILVPGSLEWGLKVSARDLDRASSKRTRGLIICSPCNPTGSVALRSNIRAIAELTRDHQCILVSDECYEFLRYDGQKHTCSAEFARDNVIVINSFSKVLAMTGLRLGYLVAPAPLMRPIYQVHQYNTACAATPAQVGAAKTLTNASAFRGIVDQHRNVLNERRKVAIECFKQIPGLDLGYTPQAGFYLFPNVQGTRMTGTKFAQTTVEKAGVIVVPGSEFGKAFPNHIRISYGASPPNRIREAAT